MSEYLADTWMTPVTIVTGVNDVFRIIEDPAGAGFGPNTVDITLDPGDHYLHADPSFVSTLDGLFWSIQKVLNDGTTAGLGTRSTVPLNSDYDFEVATPTSSTGLANNGLALRSTASAEVFNIAFNDAAFTMSPRWFGIAADVAGAPVSSVPDAADDVATMPAATRHRMVTRDLGEGHAVDKRQFNYKDVFYSSSRPSDSVAVIWDEGFERRIRYEDVRGVEVHRTRALETEWAATTGRLLGDTHAIWFDVWDALTDGKEVLLVHNSSSDLQIDTHSYEVVKLRNPLTWDAFATQVLPGGDLYHITVPVWVDMSRASYDH